MAVETSTLARPYAKAAFEYALANNAIASWSDFLNTAAMVSADKAVTQLLIDPRVGNEQCFKFFAGVCEKVMNDKQRNFLQLLAENGRLGVSVDIAALFEHHRAEHEKTVQVDVISYQPLTETEEKRIVESLRTRLQRDVEISCVVDEDLLGGAIIRAGDLVIDGSIRSKLARMREQI